MFFLVVALITPVASAADTCSLCPQPPEDYTPLILFYSLAFGGVLIGVPLVTFVSNKLGVLPRPKPVLRKSAP